MKVSDIMEQLSEAKLSIENLGSSFWFDSKTKKVQNLNNMEHISAIFEHPKTFGLSEEDIKKLKKHLNDLVMGDNLQVLIDTMYKRGWVRGFLYEDISGFDLTVTGGSLKDCQKAAVTIHRDISLKSIHIGLIEHQGNEKYYHLVTNKQMDNFIKMGKV